MNLPAHSSETSFFPSSPGGSFAHLADAKRESVSRLVSGMERFNIDYSSLALKMDEILNPLMRPNNASLSHEWNTVNRAYSSTGSYSILKNVHLGLRSHRLHSTELAYYGVIEHEGIFASALLTKEMNLAKQIHQAMQSRLGGFLRYYLPAELTSFEELMIALRVRGFNESAEEIEGLRSTDDMEPGDEPLSFESVRGFVKLMDAFQDLGEPMLGRFSAGTLSVEWRIADDKHLLVEPLDGDYASFALIGPSLTAGADRFRLNGRGKIADVVATLRNNQVDKWRAW